MSQYGAETRYEVGRMTGLELTDDQLHLVERGYYAVTDNQCYEHYFLLGGTRFKSWHYHPDGKILSAELIYDSSGCLITQNYYDRDGKPLDISQL